MLYNILFGPGDREVLKLRRALWVPTSMRPPKEKISGVKEMAVLERGREKLHALCICLHMHEAVVTRQGPVPNLALLQCDHRRSSHVPRSRNAHLYRPL